MAGDPASCVFRVNRSALVGPAIRFSPGGRDKRLVDALRANPAVAAVTLEENFISIRKADDSDWGSLIPELAEQIRDYVIDDSAPAEEPPAENGSGRPGRSAQATIATVQDFLDRQFNPAIASHGGEVRLVDYCDGRLSVEMLGGCQGCAASQMTLRSGLARELRAIAPEVTEIVDVTDHAKGTNPYFPSGG